METKFNIDTFSLAGLPNLFIKILLVFVFIWALVSVLDFFRIKHGIKDKSEPVEFDIWLFLRLFFKQTGIGVLVGSGAIILMGIIEESSRLNLTSYSFVVFYGILFLFIAKGLGEYHAETRKTNR